jgi:hypothetical protein
MNGKIEIDKVYLDKYKLYLGIPYLKGGRTDQGLSCYGLVWYYYKMELGIDLPKELPWDDTIGIDMSFMSNFKKVDKPEVNDIVLFQTSKMPFRSVSATTTGPDHFAIYVGNGYLLHASMKAGVAITTMDRLKVGLIGIYRPRLNAKGEFINSDMTSYTKITKVNQFFSYEKDNSIKFTSNKLVVRIPKSYVDNGFCTLGTRIHTLGIVQLLIDNKYKSTLVVTNTIVLAPSYIDTSSSDEFILAHFIKDDTFIPNRGIIQESEILYRIFNSFISLSKIPSFIDYDDVYKIFDNIKSANGVKLSIGHEIYEMIYSHLYRDKNDPSIQYRHTDRKAQPIIVGLRNIVYSPESTTAKLLGSYLDDGITGALLEDNPSSDPIEKILIK